MLKGSSILVFIWSMTLGSVAYAADYYSGQTGQYHTLPYQEDVQRLTLEGEMGGPCSASVSNALTLHAVDEFGTAESIPFTVPSRTVFIVTDAVFVGTSNFGNPGDIPWLNIAQTNAQAFSKASFIAMKPLVGGQPAETFGGMGSLASGAAFATGSILCAYPSTFANKFGTTVFTGMSIASVVVHGTLIDDVRTNNAPYLSW